MKRKANVRPQNVGQYYKSPDGDLFVLVACGTEPDARMDRVKADGGGNVPSTSQGISAFADWILLKEDKPRIRKAKLVDKICDAIKKAGAEEISLKPRQQRADKGTKRKAVLYNVTALNNPVVLDPSMAKELTEKMAGDWFRFDSLNGRIYVNGLLFHEATMRETVLSALDHLKVAPTREAVASYFGEQEKVQEIMAILGEAHE